MAKSPRFTRPVVRKTDSRLLGRWKSDAKQTIREWHWGKNQSLKRRRFLKSIFGKLVITYTRAKIVMKLGDFQTSQNYSILGVDKSSVAIVTFGELKITNERKYDDFCVRLMKESSHESAIQHLHFEGKRYWISLGNGSNREFFRKMPRRGKTATKRARR
jgi:hypothetical protein